MTSSPEQKASDYLKETLGDALTKILTECAEKRPDDPIAFIADGLERQVIFILFTNDRKKLMLNLVSELYFATQNFLTTGSFSPSFATGESQIFFMLSYVRIV